MNRRALFPLLVAAALPGPSAWAVMDVQRIVLASLIEQENTPSQRLLELIYTEAFRQLGVEVQFRIFPAARAQAEAVAGAVDGEMARGFEYESLQNVLMRVPEPAMNVSLSAYARDPAIRVAGLESLRGTSYRVECRAGYPVIERLLAEMVPAAQLSRIAHAEQGLRKLALGRIDLYVDAEEVVEPILAANPAGLQEIRKAGLLERRPIYAYLNRRHAGLALRLAEVLRKMRASGQLDQLRAQAFEKTPAIPR